jgi:NDP-sugar pyrophosphorylase family protein
MRGLPGEVIAPSRSTSLSPYLQLTAWALTQDAERLVAEIVTSCGDDFLVADGRAIHRSAVVEKGAALKGPCVIGANCFVSSSALLRGGCWLDADCTIGPGCELKSSFLHTGSKLAHLNFVGDSVIGADVNIEAGAMIANYRNERADKRIRIRCAEGVIDTGVDKFGALVGDHVRIGANAVIAPGAILLPRTIVARLALLDQG